MFYIKYTFIFLLKNIEKPDHSTSFAISILDSGDGINGV